MLEGDTDKVYQMQLPATSIFGTANGNDMGLQAYVKFLSQHNTPAIAVMTEARFDDDATAPKLYFRATRALEEDELKAAIEMRDSDEAKQAITFTVSKSDGVSPKPSEPKAEVKKEKPAAKKEEPVQTEMDLEPVEEPKKVTKPAKAPVDEPKSSEALASILDEWDD
jgi:outer membrane biosynthesis protein TonB